MVKPKKLEGSGRVICFYLKKKNGMYKLRYHIGVMQRVLMLYASYFYTKEFVDIFTLLSLSFLSFFLHFYQSLPGLFPFYIVESPGNKVVFLCYAMARDCFGYLVVSFYRF